MATQTSLYDQMGRGRAIFFSVALLVSAWVGCFQVAELIIVNDMYIAFPDQGDIVTAIVSWPLMFVAISSIVSGFALNKIATKTLAVISGVLLLFGIPIYWLGENVVAIFVCNVLQAVGAGACQTAGLAIINEVFLDEKRRARYVGFYNAAMTAIGSGFSFLGGFLALNGWINVFLTNWIGAAILVLVALFFPYVRPTERAEPQSDEADADVQASSAGDFGSRKGLNGRFWAFFVLMALYFVTIVPLYSLTSVLVDENQLGTSVFTGIVTGIMTGCVPIAGLVYGILYVRFKRKLTIISIAFEIIGYLWLYLAPSVPSMLTFAVVQGIAFGMVYSTIFSYATDIVEPEKNGLAMGLMVFCYNIGVFAGVYVFTFCAELMGGLTQALLVAIIIEAFVVIAEIVVQASIKRKERVSQQA